VRPCLLPLALSALLLTTARAAEPVSLRSLLPELTDLSRLAEYPDPPFTCKQFSSYDRASKSAEDPNGWFANGDCGQYLRDEKNGDRTEFVMMDTDGPGAIVRIWSANPEGTLRIYVDGQAAPALEADMKDLLSGKVAGVPEPLAHVVSAGWNCFLPIPYAKHCKVTSDKGGFYYHVNYRTYPAGTPVESFASAQLKELSKDIDAPIAALSNKETKEYAANLQSQHLGDARELAPGAKLELAKLTGSKAITGLRLNVKAADRPLALRQTLLTIAFDEEPTVTVPLGAFFGAGPGVHAFATLPTGITPEDMLWADWFMPFAKSATVQLRNLGTAPLKVGALVTDQPYTWTDRSLHFHAGWRVQRDIPTRPFLAWNYLTARGQGVFVGAAFSIANPSKDWWGEGDEKIYVDGEKFPSHFGTGTEDYYGYAWCSPGLFMQAYHSQPQCDGPGNYGRTAVNRWHLLDKIPFAKDFRFDMEIWHSREPLRVAEASVVTYWYARPGGTSTYAELKADDLRIVEAPAYVAPRVKDALEGEEFKIVAKTGVVGPQDIGGCSNEKHMWWREGQIGDKLVLAFPAPAAGSYRVFGRFLQAADYGIVQVSINGQPAGEPRDFYHDGVIVADEANLGTFTLKAGDNELTLEIIGANSKALKKYMCGLDYLRLEKAD